MKLVVGANSLGGQLTGIGYYTEGLVKSLSAQEDIEDLRLFSHGRISPKISAMSPKSNDRTEEENSIIKPSFLMKLRPVLSKIQPVVFAYDVLTAWMARYSLRKYSTHDVFHSPDFQHPPFPGKVVVTIPDLSTVSFPEFHPAARVNYVNRHLMRAIDQADHIITISEFVKQEICENFAVPPERVTTIYPGINPCFEPISCEQFETIEGLPEVTYKNYFIFVSTIEPRKNLIRLLQAYRKYISAYSDSALPLVIVGLPGWKSTQIHAEISHLAQTGKVLYLGYLSSDLLRVLLAGARALLFPSLYEGFGLPVMESFRSGTAVLTSTDSAMAEISNGASVLSSADNTKDILEGIERLHVDDNLIKRLESAGLEVGKNFSWDRCALETVALYKRII